MKQKYKASIFSIEKIQKIKKRLLGGLLSLAIVSTTISPMGIVSAGVTDFDLTKYNTLVTNFGITETVNQEKYLENLKDGNVVKDSSGANMSALPSDLVVDSLTTLVNSKSSISLDSLMSLVNTYIANINNRINAIDNMEVYMQSYDDGGIGYLEECINNLDYKFTKTTGNQGGVYCSNTQFFKDSVVTRTKLLEKQSTYLGLQLLISSKTTNLSDITEVNGSGIDLNAKTGGVHVDGSITSNDRIAADGTVGSPAFKFKGDADTGIYPIDNAGKLGISTNGVNRVTVDKDGNVGIGTTTPGANLDIKGSSPSIKIQDRDSTGDAQIGYLSFYDKNNTEKGWVGFGSTGTDDIYLKNNYNGGNINLLTAGNGNVGIGTASPSAKLDVNGGALFGGADHRGTVTIENSNTSGYSSGDPSDARRNLSLIQDKTGEATVLSMRNLANSNFTDILENNGNLSFNNYINGTYINRFFIGNNGNVGIGTTSPSESLHIKTSGSNEEARNAGLYLDQSGYTGSGNGYSYMDFYTKNYGNSGGITKEGAEIGLEDRTGDFYITRDVLAGNTKKGLYIDKNGDTKITGDLDVNGNAQIKSNDGLFIKSSTNAPTNGALIKFSDHQGGNYGQYGWIKYKHEDGAVDTGYGDGFIIGGSEPKTIVKVEGDLNIDGNIKENGTKLSDKYQAKGSKASDADRLEGHHLSEILPYHSNSNFINGTLIKTSINANVIYGDSFVMELSGKSYSSSNLPFKVILQGYIYNNTFINNSALSYGGKFASSIKILKGSDNNLQFWFPRISYWNSFNVTVRKAGGDNMNRVIGIINSTEPASPKKVAVTVEQSFNTSNDGPGSGLSADSLDGIDSTGFIKVNTSGDQIQDNTIDGSEIQDNTLTASDLAPNSVGDSEMIDNPRFKSLRFSGEGGNSGNGVINYGIYQEGGAWSYPYPDLVVGYHTGVKIGGHKNYNGTRFYNDAPGRSGASVVMEVANGDDGVKVNNNLGVGSEPSSTAKLKVSGTGLSDSKWTWTDIKNNLALELGSNGNGDIGSIKMNSYDSNQFVLQRPSNGNYHIDSTTGQYYFNWDESVRGGSNGAIHIANQSGGHTVELNTSGDSWLTGGNVGIGTTSPSQKLDVNGSIKTSGSIIGNASSDLNLVAPDDINVKTRWTRFYNGSTEYARLSYNGNWMTGYLKVSGNVYENGTALSSKYQAKGSKASDADKLDGIDSTGFVKTGTISVSGDWNNHIKTGNYMGYNLLNQCPGSSRRYVKSIYHNDSRVSQTCNDFDGNGVYQRNKVSGTWKSWRKILTNGDSGDYIADNTIDGSEIQDNTLTASDLAADSVGASELANNSVASSNIIDGSVTSSDIANNTITETDISDSFKARNADKLDNLNSTQFLRSDTNTALNGNLTVSGKINGATIGSTATFASGDWNNYITNGTYMGYNLTNQCPGSSRRYVTVIRHNNSRISQSCNDFDGTNVYQRNKVNGTWKSWRKLIADDGNGNVRINGNLKVDGTTTQTNYKVTNLQVVNPVQTLDMNGTDNNTNTNYGIKLGSGGGYASLYFNKLNNLWSLSHGLKTTGNLTVAGGYINIGSDTKFYRDAANRIATPNQFYVQSSSPNTYLYSTNTYLGASNGDTTHLRGNNFDWNQGVIQGNGNVGIGTTSPSEKLEVAGNVKVSGAIRRSSHSSGFLEGSYNNVGENSHKTNPIYTIGSSYNPTDSDLRNMYGIGYTHPNANYDGINSVLSGRGMYVAADGDARIGLDGSNGNIIAKGYINAIGGLKENGTSLSSKYQAKGSKASDADKLDGIDSTGFIKVNTSGDQIQDNTIDGSEIQDNTLTASDLAPNSVGNSELIDNPSVSTIYANNWFRAQGSAGLYFQSYGGGWNMTDSSWIRSYGGKNVYIDRMLRADNGFQVDGTQVIGGDAYVEGDRIRQNTVDSSEIQDNTLTASDLAPNSVGSSEIATNAVLSAEIKDGEVKTADIANGNVTEGKIAQNTLDDSEIQDNSLTASSLAPNSVGNSELIDTPTITQLNVAPGNDNGLRFWGSDTYEISMGNGTTHKYGPVNDYSIKTNMSNTPGRGFTWGVAGSTPKAGLEATTGNFQTAGSINAIGGLKENGVKLSDKYQVKGSSSLSESAVEGYIANDVSTNYIPRDNGTKLVTGSIYDNGTNIGIGKTSPSAKLDVNGSAHIGSILYDYPPTTDWGYTLLLNGKDTTSIGFHDNANSVGTLSYSNKTFYIGNGGTWNGSDLNVNGNIKAAGFIYQSSDRRLKKDITLLKGSALDKLTSLNGYHFTWKKNGVKDIGVIAQEVEKVYPRLVVTDDKGMKAVKYSNFISPVIEALKEIKKLINDLFEKYSDQQDQIDDLKNQNNDLEKRIEKLEKMILENK